MLYDQWEKVHVLALYAKGKIRSACMGIPRECPEQGVFCVV